MSEAAPTIKTILNPYKMQWYVELYVNGQWTSMQHMTELNSADHTAEPDEYETAYIDYKNQTKYVMSEKAQVEFELDMVGPDGVQKQLYGIEDVYNVPGRITRTLAYDFSKGAACPETALVAKQAPCVVNTSPIQQGSTTDPLRMTVTVSMNGDWEFGTFNATTSTFTKSATQAADGGKAVSA